jgi:hypothetical protein
MAAIRFEAAQSAPIMVEGERGSVRIQLPLMQINTDNVCLIRTQFQQMNASAPRARHRATPSTNAKPGAKAGLCFPS